MSLWISINQLCEEIPRFEYQGFRREVIKDNCSYTRNEYEGFRGTKVNYSSPELLFNVVFVLSTGTNYLTSASNV